MTHISPETREKIDRLTDFDLEEKSARGKASWLAGDVAKRLMAELEPREIEEIVADWLEK